MTRGLTGRMFVASGLLAVIVGGAFATVLLTLTTLRGTTDLRRQTREALVAADTLEQHIVDLESGLRAFVITRDESFLPPANDARAALPQDARAIERLAAGEPIQLARLQRIVRAMNAYVQHYALPLVDATRRNDPSVRSVERTRAGKSRVDALREGLANFRTAERTRLSIRDADVDQAARRAMAAAGVGVAGSILLIVVFAGYLTRVIVAPVRRAALMANRVAGGDLSARMPETEIAEIGALERSFNVMAGSLETSRDELGSLLAEQAALRQVATLAARGAALAEVFAVTAAEVCALLGTNATALCRYEPDATATVLALETDVDLGLRVGARVTLEGENAMGAVIRTGQAARQEGFERAAGTVADVARRGQADSSVGAPILVEGDLWGVVVVSSRRKLPADTEQRLGDFCELVATTIANAEARAEVTRLAQEQAALRRVATFVAREASQAEVFTAIAEEIGRLLGTEEIRMLRYEGDRSAVVVARWGQRAELLPIGARVPLEDESTTSRVFRTGQPTRIADYTHVAGPTAEKARAGAIRCVVATPIVVEGRLWGAMSTGTTRAELLPPDTESRLDQFTELMATAIANTESHARAARLTDEQGALRRVATLVAKESSPAEVFARVAEEVSRVVGDVDCALVRDERDGTGGVIATWGASAATIFPAGERISLDGDTVLGAVLREGRPSRIDDYSAATGTIGERARALGIRSAVGCPIVVGGRTWGAMALARSAPEPFPADTEGRLARFSELVATAIANAGARAEVERLAEEQAALRRVATLVADGPSPTAVFDAVAAEMERLLDADRVVLNRYEPDAELTVVAHRGPEAWRLPPGSRVGHDGGAVSSLVRRTERPARVRQPAPAGSAGAGVEPTGVYGTGDAVGAPIVVDGRLWGAIVAFWNGEKPAPADTEARMVKFAELLETAIANADGRDQLTASRARLLTEGDDARRRVVRDLHDGAQQRLVHTIITLKLARRAFRAGNGQAESLIDEALENAEQGNAELRELSHGILPAVLTRGGLRAGVDAFVARLDLPVHVDVPARRFGAEIEASAYFIVAEALTNVVKHAHAGRAEVSASVRGDLLHVAVRDDGSGGADPRGHGLVGMSDRAAALDGWLEIDSPAGRGTRLAATLPLSRE
jgi:signal transduction histidine kinase/CHASE3 domain sensor protein